MKRTERNAVKNTAIQSILASLPVDKEVYLNDFWNNKEENDRLKLSTIWKSRHHFLQDIQRTVKSLDTFAFRAAQRKGTFIVKVA